MLGWDWTYEPIDGNGYIPDFLLMGDRPVLVEVKPAITLEDMEAHTQKMTAGLGEIWNHDVLIVGTLPEYPDPHSSYPIIGLLGEYGEWGPDSLGWNWEPGHWHTCGKCAQPSFHHEIMSFISRLCGHYDGDHYLASAPRSLKDLWGLAHEMTMWNADSTT